MGRSPRRLAVGAAVRLQRVWLDGVIPGVAGLAADWRSPGQVVYRWPLGPIPIGSRPCVFAHWDGAGEVRPPVRHYLRELAGAGLSVLFVSNAGFLRPEALAAVQTMCAGVLIRRNAGYDFGAWREGFAALGLPRADTEFAVMANDSVYGPLTPMRDLLGHVDPARGDFWGCTETWQSRYHLQSYWLAFAPRVLASRAWAAFWAGVRPVPSKRYVILRYEIGLTQALLRAGFAGRAIWPYAALAEGDPRAVPLNPTSDLWRPLLDAGFPFIKRELLRRNPTRVPGVGAWQEVCDRLGLDVSSIEADLGCQPRRTT